MSKELIAWRKLVVKATFFSFRLKRLGQSILKQSVIKFSWSNLDQSLLKTDLLESGLVTVFAEIKIWVKSRLEMVTVTLPQIMSFEMTLLKILSIKALEWLIQYRYQLNRCQNYRKQRFFLFLINLFRRLLKKVLVKSATFLFGWLYGVNNNIRVSWGDYLNVDSNSKFSSHSKFYTIND